MAVVDLEPNYEELKLVSFINSFLILSLVFRA